MEGPLCSLATVAVAAAAAAAATGLVVCGWCRRLMVSTLCREARGGATERTQRVSNTHERDAPTTAMPSITPQHSAQRAAARQVSRRRRRQHSPKSEKSTTKQSPRQFPVEEHTNPSSITDTERHVRERGT